MASGNESEDSAEEDQRMKLPEIAKRISVFAVALGIPIGLMVLSEVLFLGD